MISLELAVELRTVGLRWRPRAGDRFTIDQPDLVGEVFTLSEMTVEPHEFPTGTVLGFNGTTEWALDSVALEDTLWLPREDQLRELLGSTFRTLDREDGRFRVVAAMPVGATGTEEAEYVADEAADAYAIALLDLMHRSAG